MRLQPVRVPPPHRHRTSSPLENRERLQGSCRCRPASTSLDTVPSGSYLLAAVRPRAASDWSKPKVFLYLVHEPGAQFLGAPVHRKDAHPSAQTNNLVATFA